MASPARRDLILAAGCLAVAAAAAAAQPRRIEDEFETDRLDELVPAVVGPWRLARGPEGIVRERVDASLLYEQTIMHTYAAPDEPAVMMVIAYRAPQSRELKIHRPETCYRVAGFRVTEPAAFSLKLEPGRALDAVTFRAVRGARTEDVLYWTRVADQFPQTLMQQRFALLRLALSGVLADGLLVRLSTLSSAAPSAQAQTVLSRFSQSLIRSCSPRGRALMLGRSGRAVV